MLSRIDVLAVGRARTREERMRRHIHGDKGATFSNGKYGVLLGRIAQTVTTFANKDSMIAEITEI